MWGSPRLALSASGGSSERAGLTLLYVIYPKVSLTLCRSPSKPPFLPLNRKNSLSYRLLLHCIQLRFYDDNCTKADNTKITTMCTFCTSIVTANICINMYRIIYVSIAINDYYYINIFICIGMYYSNENQDLAVNSFYCSVHFL